MKNLITLFLIASVFTAEGQVANKAVSFLGTSTSKASFGNINEVNGVSQFTFEAWVYIDEWKENSYIFSKIGSTSNRIDIQLGTASNKRLHFHVANNANMYAALDNSTISVGKWHHIVMAYDGTQSAYNMIQVFIDGEPVKLWYSSGNGMLPPTTPVTTADFELGRGFAGKIDEARLWNIRLSASDLELQNTINEYHPLHANLISYWKMDQGPGNIIDYKSVYNGSFSNATLVSVTDNPSFVYRAVSTYIRSNFYETGRISEESLLNNNDIIYLTANTYANGDLFFEYPVNNGILTNANHLNSFEGRSGVIDFVGSGSSMNGGKDLLNKPNAGVAAFTFASWVYVDEWEPGSYIFRKYESASKTIDMQLGDQSSNSLILHMANGEDNYVSLENSGLTPGQWHHIAVTYSGNAAANQQVKIYVDGESRNITYKNADGLLPRTGPFIRSDFELGVNFDGKLDETSLNLLSLGAGDIANLKNNPINANSWNLSKTNAYWKFDDAAAPGKDSRTWVGVLNSLKEKLHGHSGVTLRLGLSGGDWKAMIRAEATSREFARQVNATVQAFQLDGVDFDFEWCESPQEWSDYSSLILAMNDALPAASLFTVSLHPLYYRITPEAIAAVDRISIQSYGPRPNRFPYDQFVIDMNNMLAYGYPRHKLVMGLPFYGTTSDNTMITTAYLDIVKAHPNLDPNLDEVTVTSSGISRTYTFNGQTTIIKKTNSVRDESLAGVMYWDIATDVNYPNQLSLLRALNTVMNANLDVDANTPVKAQTIDFPPLQDKTVDDSDFDAGAVASSGLPVTYTSSNSDVATIVNGKIRITGAGTTIITATQEGNAFYSAADAVEQPLVVIADTEAPTTPSALSASATDETVSLTWAASSDFFGVTGYKVYKDSELVDEVNQTTYTITGLHSAVTYVFDIVATDKAGNLSEPAQIMVTTTDTQAPTAPVALTAKKAIKHEVELSWQSATDNVALVGYHIYLNGTQLSTSLVKGNSYLAPSPKGKDAYEFIVKAVDAAGNISAASNSIIIVKGIIVEPTAAAIRQHELLTDLEDEPDGVVVYPNPSQGSFKVKVNSRQKGGITISLFNASGILIWDIIDVKNGAYEKTLNLTGLAAGIYYVQVNVGSFSQAKRIMIE